MLENLRLSPKEIRKCSTKNHPFLDSNPHLLGCFGLPTFFSNNLDMTTVRIFCAVIKCHLFLPLSKTVVVRCQLENLIRGSVEISRYALILAHLLNPDSDSVQPVDDKFIQLHLFVDNC